jgi:O-antigen ligase
LSTFGRSLSRPFLLIAALVYVSVLFLELVWWHVAPEKVLALTIGGIMLLVLSLKPFLGIHVLVMAQFLENVMGVGMSGVTPTKLLGAVVLVGWIISVALTRTRGFKFDRFFLVVVLFLVWCGVSILYAVDTDTAIKQSFTYLQLALVALMFSSVVDTPERCRSVYWAVVIWTTLHTMVAILMYYLRMTSTAVGLIGNRNALASYIDVAIVCAYLLYQIVAPGLGRGLLLVSLPVLFLGLALTLSRAGLIVLVVTLLLVWYSVARRRGVLLLIGSFSMICALTFVLPNSFWKRAESIVPAIQRQQETFGTRVRLWRVALRMITDHPVVGIGPGNFVAAYPRYARGGEQLLQMLNPHNTYVGLAAENGLIGLSLFLAMIFIALLETRRGVRAGRAVARSDLEIQTIAAGVSLLAYLLSGLAGDAQSMKSLWMFFGLAVATGRMAEGPVQVKPSTATQEPITSPGRLSPWVLVRHRD